ncbi:MAG: transposase [Bacteroidales bacterium]|nr:transposase [Bacteroidales bacterium]
MKSRFEKNPYRELPDGTIAKVYPFHVSLEGLESKILCRVDSDYDAFVKIICVCAKRTNVILVIYAVVSNHVHCIVLAIDQAAANAFAAEVKRMYSMYFARKYSDHSVLKGVDASAVYLYSDYYLRNAVAYVVRNAMDNGAESIQSYPWTGYRGMFCGGKPGNAGPLSKVSELSRREKRRIMHTDDDLSRVRWLLNADNTLEPATICDWYYVEDAFSNEQSYFLRLIGGVNRAEMQSSLIDGPRVKRPDTDFLRTVNDISTRWFQKPIQELPVEKKAKLLQYVSLSNRTDPSQLARVFEFKREEVLRLLGQKNR